LEHPHIIFKSKGYVRRRKKMMKLIELTDGDKEILQEVLRNHLKEVTWEIAFTHNKDSVQYLQKRREFIEGFIQRLNS
jgi:hypothetical protein